MNYKFEKIRWTEWKFILNWVHECNIYYNEIVNTKDVERKWNTEKEQIIWVVSELIKLIDKFNWVED